jgi:hypothetical protein
MEIPKEEREKKRLKYAVELDRGDGKERFVQVEFVHSQEWLNDGSSSFDETIQTFQQAVRDYCAKEADNNTAKMEKVEASLLQLRLALR